MGDVVWGSVGEWVGGIGAAMAATVAVSVVFRDSRAQRYRQARLVSVDFNLQPTGESRREWEITIRVVNHSNEPITQVCVPTETGWLEQYDLMTGEATGLKQMDFYPVSDRVEPRDVVETVEIGSRGMPLWLQFVDNDGRVWRRHPTGRPFEMTPTMLKWESGEMGRLWTQVYRQWLKVRRNPLIARWYRNPSVIVRGKSSHDNG